MEFVKETYQAGNSEENTLARRLNMNNFPFIEIDSNCLETGRDDLVKSSSQSFSVSCSSTPGESRSASSLVALQLPSIPQPSTTRSSFRRIIVDDPAYTAPIIAGIECTIEICKGKGGLGISIVGGADTLLGAAFVQEIYRDGVAAKDGRLLPGDELLELNGTSLRQATNEQAVHALRRSIAGNIRLVVYREYCHSTNGSATDLYNVFTVDLMKRLGKGLGFSVSGDRRDGALLIAEIIKGGVAEADGRLMQGDRILAVNGDDCRLSRHEDATILLKTLIGRISLTVGRFRASSRSKAYQRGSASDSIMRRSLIKPVTAPRRSVLSKIFSSVSRDESPCPSDYSPGAIRLVSYTTAVNKSIPSSKSY